MLLTLTPFLTSLSTTATTVAPKTSKSGGSILDPVAKPIAELLAGIYSVVPSYGVAIIVLSLLWMLLISPLTLKSTRSMLAMQKLQPQLKKLQEKHKDDKQAFAQAQMDLFREHQVSPFGACLPMLLQMPLFFALFRVIDGLSHSYKGPSGATVYSPRYLSHGTRMFKDIAASHGHLDAFGMNLANNAFSHHSGVLAALPFWILVLFMGATSYIQSVQMLSRNPQAQNNPQMKMMKYLPLLFVVICIRFPAGVLLYYSVSNICRIVQQDLMYRFDPKVKALVAQEVEEVEALTHEIDEGAPRGGKSQAPTPGRPGQPGSSRSKSWWRDVMDQAEQQQRARSSAKKAGRGGGGGGSGSGSGGRSGNAGRPPTDGGGVARGRGAGSPPKARANGAASSSNGSRSAAKRPQAGSHRTNRKRRGR